MTLDEANGARAQAALVFSMCQGRAALENLAQWEREGVRIMNSPRAALNTHLVEPGVLPLETLLERMSAGPARAYGLEPPRIAVGAPANLVLLDPNASWRVTEESFRSLSANSWLLGKTLRGRVRMTVAAGRVAFEA